MTNLKSKIMFNKNFKIHLQQVVYTKEQTNHIVQDKPDYIDKFKCKTFELICFIFHYLKIGIIKVLDSAAFCIH